MREWQHFIQKGDVKSNVASFLSCDGRWAANLQNHPLKFDYLGFCVSLLGAFVLDGKPRGDATVALRKLEEATS